MKEKDLAKALLIYTKLKKYRERNEYFEYIRREAWKCSPGTTTYNIQKHLPDVWLKKLDEAAIRIADECCVETLSKISFLEEELNHIK